MESLIRAWPASVPFFVVLPDVQGKTVTENHFHDREQLQVAILTKSAPSWTNRVIDREEAVKTVIGLFGQADGDEEVEIGEED